MANSMFSVASLYGSQVPAIQNAYGTLGFADGGGGRGGIAGAYAAQNQASLTQEQISIVKKVVKSKETIVDNQTIPDISLSRVFKWAIVFIVALTLGKKAWSLFGEKITANLHNALDSAAK